MASFYSWFRITRFGHFFAPNRCNAGYNAFAITNNGSVRDMEDACQDPLTSLVNFVQGRAVATADYK